MSAVGGGPDCVSGIMMAFAIPLWPPVLHSLACVFMMGAGTPCRARAASQGRGTRVRGHDADMVSFWEYHEDGAVFLDRGGETMRDDANHIVRD